MPCFRDPLVAHSVNTQKALSPSFSVWYLCFDWDGWISEQRASGCLLTEHRCLGWGLLRRILVPGQVEIGLSCGILAFLFPCGKGGGQAWGRAAYLFDAFQRRMNVYMWFRVGVEGLRQILLCSWFSHPSCSTVFSLLPVQYLLVVIAEEMERYCVGEWGLALGGGGCMCVKCQKGSEIADVSYE